jgi:dTMP kinase
MRLFVIEGVDGAGKSTQIKLLNNYLANKGKKTEYLHFPRTEAPYFGELIARFLRGEFGSLNEVNPWLVAMLYAGDRKDAAETIANWLKKGSVVLLDRYTYSNIAYQCAKIQEDTERKRLMDWILDLEFNHFKIPKPDINIFLDVPFAFTENRLTSERSGNDRDYLMGTKDIHEESLEFQKKVRDIYLSLPSHEKNFAIVDCGDQHGDMLKPDEIFEKITHLLDKRKLLDDL